LSDLLTSRLTLAAAWFVVVAGLAAALTLALMQPPPPAGGPDVTIVMKPPVPSMESPEAAPENTAALSSASVDLPRPAVEAAPEAEPEAPAAGPAPAQGETEAPAPELPAASAALPQPAAEPEPASEAVAEPASPAAEQDTAAEDAPAAVVALPPPPAKPEPPAAGHGQAEAPEAGGTPGEQQVAIPTIPPALEQLPTWERFRQPFNLDDKRPRIAVVLTGLGLSDSATEAAINQLPPAVTLSFSPYARGLERWIALARARGHEVMLDLPMEPATFPNEDPGPQGLLVGLSAEENLNRLDWVLSRGSAYVGLAGAMGSRFTASRDSVEPVLRELKERGLIFLDRRTTENSLVTALAEELGLPAAVNNRSVDERQASRVAIDARLAQIERIALTEGFAVAMAQPYPITLDRLAEWSTEITSRGFALAPISALADRQTAP
jgi:polysaccharide deacetylase 2 family uncharacterized protein YibQ